jgi:predicted PurR-regulated permease PerM
MKITLILLGVLAAIIGLWFLDEFVGVINPFMLIGCMSVGFYSILWLANRLIIKSRSHRWMFICAYVFFLVFFTFHIIMSIQLSPIKEEFSHITLVTQPRQFLDETVVSGVKLNYKGELDTVLAKRDALLKKHGYIMIGKWWVTSGDADTARIVYLKDFTKLFRKGG